MSKAISYYDWSLGFSKVDDKEERKSNITNKNPLNSIGIAEDDFKAYIKKWKSNNLN